MAQLLVVDDEPSICWGLKQVGSDLGCKVETASSAERAISLLERFRPDVIVLDVRLPGQDGLTALQQIREIVGPVPVIVMTAYGDLQTAVRAIRVGASDYLTKPFDLETVREAIRRALRSPDPDQSELTVSSPVDGLVGRSRIMQDCFAQLALAAESDSDILISGESGTGKDLAARAIHSYSRRCNGPFLPANVAALSETLAESELFGHVQGAFTGADYPKDGLLLKADGGTLFLDEVAEIPLPLQVKLLRAVESGEFYPVGSTSAVSSDFRIVAATHRDLNQRMAEGKFRHDLYFRLATFTLYMPPLRSRREDIPELARHLANLAAARNGQPAPELTEAAIAELKRRHWSGNVRELGNVIEHAMIVARNNAIDVFHLPQELNLEPERAAGFTDDSGSDAETRLGVLVEDWARTHLNAGRQSGRLYDALLEVIETPLLRSVMERHGGNCAAAARELGLHRITLRRKLDAIETRHASE